MSSSHQEDTGWFDLLDNITGQVILTVTRETGLLHSFLSYTAVIEKTDWFGLLYFLLSCITVTREN